MESDYPCDPNFPRVDFIFKEGKNLEYKLPFQINFQRKQVCLRMNWNEERIKSYHLHHFQFRLCREMEKVNINLWQQNR